MYVLFEIRKKIIFKQLKIFADVIKINKSANISKLFCENYTTKNCPAGSDSDWGGTIVSRDWRNSRTKKNHHFLNFFACSSPSLTKRARDVYSFVCTCVYISLRLSFLSIELFTGLFVFPCADLISNILEPVLKSLYSRCL